MGGKLIDLALIVCLTVVALYTAYTFGAQKGFTEGQIRGYWMGWDAVYEDMYYALRDSVNYYCR